MLNKTLFLEIDKPNYVPIYTVQYDYNSRFYEITILNNSQPLDLTGIRVIVAGKKPDGEEVFNSCKVLDEKKGLIQLELTEQMNAVSGLSEYSLELFSADGMLSSQPFKLNVTRSTIPKTIESSRELGALKDALNEVQNIDQRFAETNAQLSTKANASEYVKKGYGTLSDFDEETRRVILGMEHGEINAVLGDGNVISSNIRDGAISSSKLGDGVIRSRHLISAETTIDLFSMLTVGVEGHYISSNGEYKALNGWYVSEPVQLNEVAKSVEIKLSIPKTQSELGAWCDVNGNYTEPINCTVLSSIDGVDTIVLKSPAKETTTSIRLNVQKGFNYTMTLKGIGAEISGEHIKKGSLSYTHLEKQAINNVISVVSENIVLKSDTPMQYVQNKYDATNRFNPDDTYALLYLHTYSGFIFSATSTSDVTINQLKVAIGEYGNKDTSNIVLDIYRHGEMDGNIPVLSDLIQRVETKGNYTVAPTKEELPYVFDTNREYTIINFDEIQLTKGDKYWFKFYRKDKQALGLFTTSTAGGFPITVQDFGGTTTNDTDVHQQWVINGCVFGFNHVQYKNMDDVLTTTDDLEKLKNQIEESTLNKSYCDLSYTRSAIGDFLVRWMNKEHLNVVCIGDSITNFQNSEILPIEEQKSAPLGLQGNSWVRRLWKLLNYDVYDNEYNVVNENGRLGTKRYDHADFNFVGGYQGTSASVGNYKWFTNRSDANDSYRNNNFIGYPQVITPESTCNKMYIGSNSAGASCSVTVPSEATNVAIIFGKCSGIVNVKISVGGSVTVNQEINLSQYRGAENHITFNVVTGTKTITITNVSGTIWLYGVEYWNENCVRVVNGGLAGNQVSGTLSQFDALMSCFDNDKANVDLVVWEVNSLNDCRNTISETLKNAKQVCEKLKDMEVPVLAIMTHRHANGQDNLQYDRYNPIYGSNLREGDKFVGYKFFYPDFIRLYKSLAYGYGFGVIDMFSKSVDESGGKLVNSASGLFPSGYFCDGIHLGIAGNNSYEEELRKVFYWNDFE